jgi:ribosome-binding protein aMBF1 (putative translation factor)
MGRKHSANSAPLSSANSAPRDKQVHVPVSGGGQCKNMPNRSRSTGPKAVIIALPRKGKRPPDPREATFNKDFGQRLRTARELKGSSQAALASALGVGMDAYKKYEYGTRAFPLYLLRDLAIILDRSISWLLTGRG